MGDRRSKEDDVLKISTSIYVTNFPEYINAKELWRICSQYGNVIDTFIPNRRSKIGKRFGFVCFIKTSDVDRLVNNLCTIWIGRFKLHANVARFNRQPMHKGSHQPHVNVKVNSPSEEPVFKGGAHGFSNSYIQAFKTGINSHNVVEYSKPSLVLDELCFHNYDFSLSLVDQLKEFGSLPNLKKILEKKVSYSFSIDERGLLLYEEDEDAPYFHRKRLCWAPDFSNSHDDSSESDDESVEGKSKDVYSEKVSEVEEIPKTIFKVEEPGEIKFSAMKENKSEDLEEVQSDDPFNLYDLLEKNNQTSMLLFNQKGSQSHFKRVGTLKTGVSMLQLIGDLIKVGSNNVIQNGGLHKRQRSDHEKSRRDINMFHKENSTVSDYFIAIMGKWIPNDKNLLIISVYAPQELSKNRMLWQYLVHVIEGWKGDVIVMGDFNEVRTAEDRFGSIFNARGLVAFNSFISTGGLVDVPSGGYSYTRAHKSTAKMSKLDRFLISKDLMRIWPNVSSIILDRYLSDQRPILLHEISLDYGPTSFCFFHNWFDLDGFNLFVTEAWKAINIQEPNAMLKLVKKLKLLKGQIRLWVKDKKDKEQLLKNSLKKKLAAIDSSLDKEDATSDALEDRLNTMNNLTNLERMESLELAQKAKIKWSIEGDENSKKIQVIINKQRNNLAIRGI
ncbi:RNA-directed DNA polymerase, eukaryota [Tanacetum coccineum]